MIKLDREQGLALAALGALLLLGLAALGFCYGLRADAAADYAAMDGKLARLEAARARARLDAHGRPIRTSAPDAAFLKAPTLGRATALLQTYLEETARAQHAVLVSSGPKPIDRNDPPYAIRLEVTLNLPIEPLQALLYRIETGTPYIVVDSLSAQPASATKGAPQDPQLHVTLGLKAFWRRGTA